MFWVLYLISFFLLWYENKTIVLDISKRPLIFSSLPFFQPLLFMIRLAFQYGSIAGIWYTYNLYVAIIAFVISYLFGKITFRIYFNREIRFYMEPYMRKGLSMKERLSYPKSYEIARKMVLENMKKGGRAF